MIIEENYTCLLKCDKRNRVIILTLVECEHWSHIGERRRMIRRKKFAKDVGLNVA